MWSYGLDRGVVTNREPVVARVSGVACLGRKIRVECSAYVCSGTAVADAGRLPSSRQSASPQQGVSGS
jgi:hypothetical protein